MWKEMQNKGGVLTPELLATLDDAELLAKLAVEGLRAGRQQSISRGYGGAFEQYRDYVPGDDAKYVDWKLFARQNRLCTKIFREETDMRLAILLDASGSMDYCGRRSACGKYRYAVMLTACLAHLAHRHGDTVGVFAHGGGKPYRSLSSEPSWSLSRMLSSLLSRVPRGVAAWDEAVLAAEDFLRGRGMVILVSDFLGDEAFLSERLKTLRLRHQEALVFHVLDDDELDFPFAGCQTYVDAETGREVAATGTDIRGDYLQQMDGFLKRIRESCLDAQVDWKCLRTSDDLGAALTEFLSCRQGRQRR